jgi:hypothetical protein
MAHPSRSQYFKYLKDALGDVPFSIDTGFGIWENCKRAWLLHNPNSEYHIVLQDDAIISETFSKMIIPVLIEMKRLGQAGSLFFGNRSTMRDIALNGLSAGFVSLEKLHWGLAVCLPVELIKPMIEFGDKMNIKQDDTRISRFLESRKIKVYYPIPSLIDHRVSDSLVGDNGVNRKAFNFK